jgi:hypothetical protein
MHRSEGTNIAVGALLIGIGAVILGLLAPVAAAVVAAVSALAGGYLILGVYRGWPLPTTATERLFRPSLTSAAAHVISVHGHKVVFQIGIENAGRGDVPNGLLNVVVPEFVSELHRCTESGRIGQPEHKGAVSHTSEALLPDEPETHSIYWNGNVSYPGRMSRIIYFRATISPIRDFPLRLKVIAPDLDEPFDERFFLAPLAFMQQTTSPEKPQQPETNEQGS